MVALMRSMRPCASQMTKIDAAYRLASTCLSVLKWCEWKKARSLLLLNTATPQLGDIMVKVLAPLPRGDVVGDCAGCCCCGCCDGDCDCDCGCRGCDDWRCRSTAGGDRVESPALGASAALLPPSSTTSMGSRGCSSVPVSMGISFCPSTGVQLNALELINTTTFLKNRRAVVAGVGPCSDDRTAVLENS